MQISNILSFGVSLLLPGCGGGQCDRAAPGGGDDEAADLPAGVRAQPPGAGAGGGRGAGRDLHPCPVIL